MPKGKLNIRKEDMPKFVAACELADVKIDKDNSKAVGNITMTQVNYKTSQQLWDAATYMNEVE